MSDSDNSNSLPGAPDIGLQEIVFNIDKEPTSDDNLIHLTVKQEEECIIMDDSYDSENEEKEDEVHRKDSQFTMFGHEYEIKTIEMPSLDETIDKDSEVNIGASTSYSSSADCEIVRIDPPSGMGLPPQPVEVLPEDEEQFAIIHDDEKTDEADTSLVDHLYSQPETSNKEFCDDLVQEMLKDTGLVENASAVTLLSKFTEMCEHFLADDDSSQITAYLKSMKKTLIGFEVPKVKEKVEEAPKPEKIEEEPENVEEETKKSFTEVPMTQESAIDTAPSSPATADFEIEIPETELMTQESEEAPKVNEEEEKLPMIVESEIATKLKADMKLVQEITAKTSDGVGELLKVSLENDEETAATKEKLVELLKNTRLELRNLQLDVTGEKSLKEQPEIVKQKVISDLSDSDLDSSDSEFESKNLKRKKMPKNGPETPAIVSSTKDDSDVASGDEAAADRRGSISSDTEKVKNIDKDIERLLNFETLHNKPAPSKTLKAKKLKKVAKQKTVGDISDSYSSLSEEESEESNESVS